MNIHRVLPSQNEDLFQELDLWRRSKEFGKDSSPNPTFFFVQNWENTYNDFRSSFNQLTEDGPRNELYKGFVSGLKNSFVYNFDQQKDPLLVQWKQKLGYSTSLFYELQDLMDATSSILKTDYSTDLLLAMNNFAFTLVNFLDTAQLAKIQVE